MYRLKLIVNEIYIIENKKNFLDKRNSLLNKIWNIYS